MAAPSDAMSGTILQPQEPAPAKKSAAKRKSATPASAPRSAKRAPKAEPTDDAVGGDAEAKPEEAPRRRKADKSEDVIMIKEEPAAESETEALQTLGEAEDGLYRCAHWTGLQATPKSHRLVDFAVVDAAGDMQPLDAMTTHSKELFITGAIYAKTADLKNKDAGRRVQRIGPIASWALELRATSLGPQVTLTTAGGRYLAAKPSQRYRKTHDHLAQQGAIAWEVLACIDPSRGGAADASLESVVAKITRAGVGGPMMHFREFDARVGDCVCMKCSVHTSPHDRCTRDTPAPVRPWW